MLTYIIAIIDVRIVLLITVLTLLIKLILGSDSYFRKIDSQVPGPFPLPIFGNSLSFIRAGKNGLGDLQTKYIKKYGRLYKTWIGNQFVVQISHPDDLEAVFLNSKALGKGNLLWSYNNCFGDGLFTDLNVSNWKKNRKRLEPYFTKDVIKCISPAMNKSIYKTIEKLKKRANGSEFDITDIIYNLSLDFITSTAYDFETSEKEKRASELRHNLDQTNDILSMQLFLPVLTTTFFRFLFDKLYVKRIRNYYLNFIKEVISKKLSDIKNETGDSDKAPSFSGILYSSYKFFQNTGNENLMLDEIMTLIIGGSDTTARTISNNLLMMATHPHIQEKVYQEIFEIFRDDDRQADLYDCDRLPYLDQVIKETFRRFTLFPVIFRKAEGDIKIGRYTFPPETQFMINVGGIHFNPEYYPNPYEFNPENFTVEAIRSRHKYSYLPFGAGPRSCIGKNLAELEIKLALIAILRTFRVYTSKTLDNLNVSVGLIQRNSDGINLRFELRKTK